MGNCLNYILLAFDSIARIWNPDYSEIILILVFYGAGNRGLLNGGEGFRQR